MLWPNLHGAFLLGIGAIGLRGLLQFHQNPTSGRWVILWTLVCVAATGVNPYGFGLWIGILQNMRGNLEQIYEWAPPSGLGFLFFDLTAAFSLLSCTLKKKWTGEDLYAALILLLFAGYAFRHERFVHFFTVCAFPYAARFWLTSPWRHRLSDLLIPWERAALVGVSILLLVTSAAAVRSMRGGVDAASSGYIPKVCDFIESHKIQGPFYNDYKFGSYLIWRFKGNPPVFQDGRHASVIGYDRLLDSTEQAQRSPRTWNAYMDKLGIQAALVRYPPRSRGKRPAVFDTYFPQKNWELVYGDDLSLLFVRRKP